MIHALIKHTFVPWRLNFPSFLLSFPFQHNLISMMKLSEIILCAKNYISFQRMILSEHYQNLASSFHPLITVIMIWHSICIFSKSYLCVYMYYSLHTKRSTIAKGARNKLRLQVIHFWNRKYNFNNIERIKYMYWTIRRFDWGTCKFIR